MARILLVEPDRAIREFMAGILTEFGHDVMACENLIAANVWVATSPFDVLVTDVSLRGEQGVTLSKSCGALGIRMVTLTGREFHAGDGDAARLPSLVEKPFRFSDLQRVLEAVETPLSRPAIRGETISAA
jgi:DNA-binding NtrC family response regulator